MNKTLTVLVCIMVAGVVVGASLPIFDSLTASSESVHNDGAGWVRFALDRNVGTEYTVTISEDENGVYVTNGSDVQTYDDSSTADFETILYADSNLSVWCDSVACHVMGVKDGVPQYYEGMDAVTIVRDADGVTVTPGSNEPLQFDVPTWAYIPVSTGNYGFFAYDEERGVQNYPSDMPLAVVGGGNVGVYAYNDIYRYNGLGLRMNPIYDDDGLFYGASWSKTAAADESLSLDPLNPAAIDLTPIDIDLDPLNPEPDVSIMAVPTPTYTDGDWGYDLATISGVQKAVIVSYSGVGGGAITVPSTIGGYEVYRFGKGGNGYNVFDTSLSATDLIISEGIVEINKHACNSCSGFTGSLVIPSTVKSIGERAFYNCSGFTGALVIPSDVTVIESYTFFGCNGFTSLELNEGLTQIKSSAFSNFIGVSGSLVIPSTVVTLNSSAFAYSTGFTDALVIPNSVESIGTYVFNGMNKIDRVIISSDATPGTQTFSGMNSVTEILDLSETINYSTDRYQLPNSATVYDTIGDCFGFVGIVDYTIPAADGGAVSQLISMLPLIMVLGLVLVAVGMFIWNRM